MQTMNAVLLTGVTFICSMVPASFSETMLREGKKAVIMVMAMTIRAGIMNSL